MGGWGLQSHFRVQPTHCVEVVLRCIVVGVVTTLLNLLELELIFDLSKITLTNLQL